MIADKVIPVPGVPKATLCEANTPFTNTAVVPAPKSILVELLKTTVPLNPVNTLPEQFAPSIAVILILKVSPDRLAVIGFPEVSVIQKLATPRTGTKLDKPLSTPVLTLVLVAVMTAPLYNCPEAIPLSVQLAGAFGIVPIELPSTYMVNVIPVPRPPVPLILLAPAW